MNHIYIVKFIADKKPQILLSFIIFVYWKYVLFYYLYCKLYFKYYIFINYYSVHILLTINICFKKVILKAGMVNKTRDVLIAT